MRGVRNKNIRGREESKKFYPKYTSILGLTPACLNDDQLRQMHLPGTNILDMPCFSDFHCRKFRRRRPCVRGNPALGIGEAVFSAYCAQTLRRRKLKVGDF